MLAALGRALDRLRPAPPPAPEPELLASPGSIVDPADFAARALSVRDTGLYDLHCGSGAGDAPTPLNARGRSNCSRYVLWLWKLGGRLPRGLSMAGYGEVNTTALYHEARGTKGGRRELIIEVPVGEEVLVGDVLVYPGVTIAGKRVKIGHTGGVVGVQAGWRYTSTEALAQLRVSHCNAGPAPAIDETNGRGFAAKGAIVVRLRRRW
jgi:hypothetical protein